MAAKIKGATITGLENGAAGADADIVVLTVPYANHGPMLKAARDGAQGKILVDATVPLVPPKVARVQLPAAGSAASAGVVETPLGAFDAYPAAGVAMIGRNAGQGPAQIVLNVGAAKVVRPWGSVGSSPYLVFNLSASNILNRTNYADFNGVVTSPSFGVANRALDPRRVELGARLAF